MPLFGSKSKKKKKTKLNLRQRLLPGIAIMLSLATLVYVSQSDWRPPEQPDLAAAYKAEARQYAVSVANSMQVINQRLDEYARTPSLAEQLGDNDSVLLIDVKADTDIDSNFPELLSIRLIAPRTTRVDDSANPTLSYACFDLVVETGKEGKTILAEAHLFGANVQHIDFVRPIYNVSNEKVGGLLASFSITLLKKIMPKVTENKGYYELKQAGQALAKAGSNAERGFDPYDVRVQGTRWKISYWPAERKLEHAVDYAGQQLLAVGVIALMIFVASVFLAIREWRRAKNTVEEYEPDEESDSQQSLLATDEFSGDILFQSGEGIMVVDEMDEGETEENKDVLDTVLDASIFKAYDIRGIVNKTLTKDAVYLIGLALGSEARAQGESKIVVARDGRNSGPDLLASLSDGLRAAGMDVISIGMAPTPVLYFAAAQTIGSSSGVMLTGSHNPPDYNGLKMVIAGTTLAAEQIQALHERIKTKRFESGNGSFTEKEVIQQYIQRITGDIMLMKKLKVVIDCGNGAAGAVAPQLMKELGCDVVELFCEVDGNFPNHHPDPSKPENLQDLITAVKEQKADIGLAFDGDGDRIGVVTNEGEIIWPDRTMMLYAIDILSRNPGAEIIYDVKCSRNLAKVIEEHGGVATMWKTGHSFIKRKLKESGAQLAGEMSGHIFFKERWYGFDDAMYSAARLVELLCPMTADKTVAEIFDALPNSVNTPEINVSMEEGKHHAYMEKLQSQVTFDDAKVTTIDGVRADFSDGWGLVRASNTTPVLVLRFEADTDMALARIMKLFRDKMREVDPNITLSF